MPAKRNHTQHVNFDTRDKNYILDLVVTSFDTSLAPAVSFTHWFPSDHFPVFTRLSINPAPLPPPTLHSFRRLSSIDLGSILTDAFSDSDDPKCPKLPLALLTSALGDAAILPAFVSCSLSQGLIAVGGVGNVFETCAAEGRLLFAE